MNLRLSWLFSHLNGAVFILVIALCVAASQTPSGPVRITANLGKTVHRMGGGIGASWHAIEASIPVEGDRSHGGSGWGANPPPGDDAAWQEVYRHADWLGLDFCRVEVEQRMYEPERGRFVWDNQEMRILYRILDWCERRNVDVFLQQMWGNTDWNAFPEFRGDPVKRVHSGPYSMEDFADGLAALTEHLVRTRGYRCIKWLSISNEPGYDWSWWQRPPNEPMPIGPGLAAVRKALDARGLAISLSGPDWTDLPAFNAAKIDFDAYIGAYDLHSYYAAFDWLPKDGYTLAEADKRLRDWVAWAHGRNKPLFLSEVGTMVFGWRGSNPGPGTYEAALKDAELVIRALNIGVDGFNRWSFINRGDLDGQWQMIDTWDGARKQLLKTFAPRPNPYFVYGLLSRFTAKHSAVVQCGTEGGMVGNLQRVFAATLQSGGGETTMIVLNDAPSEWQAAFALEGIQKDVPLYKYQISTGQRDRADLKIDPVRELSLSSGAGTFRDILPASSVTIFTSYRLAHSDPGVTVN